MSSISVPDRPWSLSRATSPGTGWSKSYRATTDDRRDGRTSCGPGASALTGDAADRTRKAATAIPPVRRMGDLSDIRHRLGGTAAEIELPELWIGQKLPGRPGDGAPPAARART